MGSRSFSSEVFHSSHQAETHAVNFSNLSDAVLVDSTEGNVGSSSRNSKAESPTSLIQFFSTFCCTFLEFIFTSLGAFAFLVLVGASFFDTLDKFWRLSVDKTDKYESSNDDFHFIKSNIKLDKYDRFPIASLNLLHFYLKVVSIL